MLSPGAVRAVAARLPVAGTGASEPASQSGSSPHWVMNSLPASRCASLGGASACGHSTTPSSSPSPEEYQGRLR